MLLLILGVVVFALAHWFKRFAPGPRAALGDLGKAIVAIVLIGSVMLMIAGYKQAEFIPLWQPPAFMVHINNLLMLVAFFIFGTSATTGRLRGWTRHPMLLSVKVWAVAHLLVNGDLASIVLFGGLLIWAVLSVVIINRAEPVWDRPEPGEAKKDILLVVITLVTFGITVGIHIGVGVWPFPV